MDVNGELIFFVKIKKNSGGGGWGVRLGGRFGGVGGLGWT